MSNIQISNQLLSSAGSGGGTSISAAMNQQQRVTGLFNRSILVQLSAVIVNSSLIFKTFCVAVLIGYCVSFNKTLNDYMSAIPGKLLPPNLYVWTLFTHSFVEHRIIELLTDWFILLLYSKMLEPLWGTLECLRFYFIITSLVSLITAFTYFILFAVTFDEKYLFNRYIHGLGALLGAFSVAIKQIMPDTILVDVSFLRLKQDNLPLLLILIAIVVYAVGLTELTYVFMLTYGVFFGWIYLRFFQKHNNGTRGDSSSSFVFASLFPSQIQPFIAIIANTIFNLLVRLKICKAQPKRYNVSSFGHTNSLNTSTAGSQSHITITIPLIPANSTGAEALDADRRRAKALRALKERLKKPGDDEEIKSEWNDGAVAVNDVATTPLITEKQASQLGGETIQINESNVQTSN